MKSQMVALDVATGQVLPLKIYIPRSRTGVPFMLLFQDAAEMLERIRLSGSAHRVLWALLRRMDYENRVIVTQHELAEELGMQRQNVNRALRELKLAGLVALQRPGLYVIHPDLVWKGKPHRRALVRQRIVETIARA